MTGAGEGKILIRSEACYAREANCDARVLGTGLVGWLWNITATSCPKCGLVGPWRSYGRAPAPAVASCADWAVVALPLFVLVATPCVEEDHLFGVNIENGNLAIGQNRQRVRASKFTRISTLPAKWADKAAFRVKNNDFVFAVVQYEYQSLAIGNGDCGTGEDLVLVGLVGAQS